MRLCVGMKDKCMERSESMERRENVKRRVSVNGVCRDDCE